MADTTRRTRSDSVKKAVEVFQVAADVIPVPEGFQSDHPEFGRVWEAFTRARAKEDWRPMDLILLARVCDLEVMIREQREAIKFEGVIAVNTRGTQVENPRLRVFDTLVRQQMAIIRSMSLNTTDSDSRTVAKASKQEEKAVQVLKEHGPESLLAMPN